MPSDADTPRRTTASRRAIILGVGVIATGGAVAASTWFNIFSDADASGALTARVAHQRAASEDIYLIDIRRPDEWQRTGIAVPAIPLDMRRDDFGSVLRDLFEQRGPRPVALICARGVRSNRMNERLKAAGFAAILDVPEGMLGSGAGAGYIAQELPLRPPSQTELDGEI